MRSRWYTNNACEVPNREGGAGQDEGDDQGEERAAPVLSGSSDDGESRTVETEEGKRRRNRKYTKKGAAMMKEGA